MGSWRGYWKGKPMRNRGGYLLRGTSSWRVDGANRLHPEALALHRKALAVRRALAAARADVETLDVARSLGAIGRILLETGDTLGWLKCFAEQHDMAAAMQSEYPTGAVQAVLARASQTPQSRSDE